MQPAESALHISQDDADEYVLGLLDPGDEARIALHVATCDACQALIDEATEITGQIALAAPAVLPPSALKLRVLREAGIARQPAWRRIVRYARPAAVAAVIVIAIGALAGVIALQSQVNGLKDDNHELRSQLHTANSGTALVAALLSPGSVMAPITSAGANNQAAGRLIWNDQQQKCWLVFDNLPALPGGETYQLWARSDDGTVWSLGVFSTPSTGVAQYTATVGHDISDYSAAIVTVEKAGGSEKPTSPAVYRADLSTAASEYR